MKRCVLFFFALALNFEASADDLSHFLNKLIPGTGFSFDNANDRLVFAYNEDSWKLDRKKHEIFLERYDKKEKISLQMSDTTSFRPERVLHKGEWEVSVINLDENGPTNFSQCLPQDFAGTFVCVTLTKNFCDKARKLLGENAEDMVSVCRDHFSKIGGLFDEKSDLGKEMIKIEEQNMEHIKSFGGRTSQNYEELSEHFNELSSLTSSKASFFKSGHVKAWNYFLRSLNLCEKSFGPLPEKVPVPKLKTRPNRVLKQ